MRKKLKIKNLAPCAAVIAAGGKGLRMGTPVRKQFIEIGGGGGKIILGLSIELFLCLEEITKVVVVLPGDALEDFRTKLKEQDGTERIDAVAGGESRQESVYNGLTALDTHSIRAVAIHDAARPLVDLKVVRETLKLASEGKAAAACTPVRDTVKRAEGKFIGETLERQSLWLAQTPQSFPLEMILDAHHQARRDGFQGTDDASLCERLGLQVRIVASDAGNIKVTSNADLDYLEYRLEGEKMHEGGLSGSSLRIGEGYDVHAFEKGRKLIIGGVEIPFERGLVGHSDADVLLHAVTDALLGAAALGDIGRLFPDSDPAFKDVDSTKLLGQVVSLLEQHGFRPVNLDATVIAQRPKLAPWIEPIRERIAGLLGLDTGLVSVKAKTHEGLGALGRGEGIAAKAAVLVRTWESGHK